MENGRGTQSVTTVLLSPANFSWLLPRSTCVAEFYSAYRSWNPWPPLLGYLTCSFPTSSACPLYVTVLLDSLLGLLAPLSPEAITSSATMSVYMTLESFSSPQALKPMCLQEPSLGHPQLLHVTFQKQAQDPPALVLLLEHQSPNSSSQKLGR